MSFSKGRLTWEVLIAGAVMGVLGAISNFFGWQAAAAVLPESPAYELAVEEVE